MNICICTTPIRPYPTDFPPLGSMAIIQSLRKTGEEVNFFNIDYFRPSEAEIVRHFQEHQFDIVGISAVVSTAYVYTKYLASLIRRVSPGTIIIVGGNLAASAEILLRKCEVDICVAGDGEIIIRELVRVLYEKPLNYARLREIKGICFLGEQDEFCFTGYGEKPSAEEIESPDYDILEADGSLPHFIYDNVLEHRPGDFDEVIIPGKKAATVVGAKGCVSHCTFCHRFEKGYRVRPVDQTIEHIRYLMRRYNVGYITFLDENFGSDRKATWELVSRLGELNVKWLAAGVRTRTVSRESLQHWKDNGCVSVYFGVEAGSETILKIMEKNASVEENINALKWTGEAGLHTIVQLVLGMPGENDETINETIEFLKQISSSMSGWKDKAPTDLISVNYAQALPGTPLYEYARQHGLIGRGIDDEEQYLIKISDTDAYGDDHFVNNTGLPLLKVLAWRPVILAHLDAHHYKAQGPGRAGLSLLGVMQYYVGIILNRLGAKLGLGKAVASDLNKSGYFNISGGLKFAPLLLNPVTRYFFYQLVMLAVVLKNLKSPLRAMRMLLEYARWKLKPAPLQQNLQEQSLRKQIDIVPSSLKQGEEDRMIPLRKGR